MNRFHALLLAALGVWAPAGCSRKGDKATLPAPSATFHAVRIAKPATRIDTGLARVTGTIRAKNDAVLAAKATGQIKRLAVGLGDRVRAGQALVEMDSANAVISVENARAAERLAAANLENAEKELVRAQALFDSQGIPESAFDRAKTGRALAAAQLDQARAGLHMAQQMLADTTLIAPFSGVVTRKFQNAGNTVTLMPVSPILALTDTDHLEVQLAAPEAIESFVALGQKIEGVTTPGGQRFAARVRAKSAAVDPVTRTVEVLADVVSVVGPALRPGTVANVDFGGFGAGGGLFVPATAVRSEGAETWVFVVVGGKAERRAVQASPVHPGTFAVKRGLDPQSDVILDPGTLAAGERVIPLPD